MAYYVRKRVHEILEEFEKQTTREAKIDCLRKYGDVTALRDVLRGTFDPTIVWLLPEGAPPYTPAKDGEEPSSLLRQNVKFTYFAKGGKGSQIIAPKREKIFLDVLESIHPKDALVLLNMKDKKPPAKGLTKKIVEEAFPGLIRG